MAKKKQNTKKDNTKSKSQFNRERNEEQGTIHELESRLANIAEYDKDVPVTKSAIDYYIKEMQKLKLFPKGYDKKKKTDLVKKILVANFNAADVEETQNKLKAATNFNRIIERHREKLEKEIRAGKNVKKNNDLLKGNTKMQIDVPRNIRETLNLRDKELRLNRYPTEGFRNKIKYYSGQKYDFIIRDNFNKGRVTAIPYDKLQKIREKGNIVEYVLKILEDDVSQAYLRDKRKYFKDKSKWNPKKKVYDKLFKVIHHNLQIATNERYNKKLVSRDKEGQVKKDTSEYPVLLKIFDDVILVEI